MKILASGDKHLGLVSDGVDRIEEQKKILDEVVGWLNEHNPDVFVDLGDLCDVPRPTPETHALGIRYAINVSDWKSIDAKRKAYFLRGNHDVTSRGRFSSLEPIRTIGEDDSAIPTVISSPTVEVYGKDYLLVLIPYVTPADPPKGVSPQDYLDEFADTTLDRAKTEGRLLIVFAHLEVEGARTSEWDTRYRDVGLSVPTALLESDLVERIFTGHVHRYQMIGERTTVVGSAIHVDFGEATDAKGAILYTSKK